MTNPFKGIRPNIFGSLLSTLSLFLINKILTFLSERYPATLWGYYHKFWKSIFEILSLIGDKIPNYLIPLTWIFFLIIIGLLLKIIKQLQKSNEQHIKQHKKQEEFIECCSLKWKVSEFEKSSTKTPLPYCPATIPPTLLTKHAHDSSVFHCNACEIDHTLLSLKNEKVTHNQAIKLTRKKIRKFRLL